jgi:enamine deaminase RidA (YjgF/YER057c/UK114 family)
LEAGQEAARLAALGCLASLESEIGSLDRLERIVILRGFVNCDPEFKDLPQVTDAASKLLIAIFGDDGRHARTTIGVASLPFGVAVEIDMVALVRSA